MNAYHRRIKDEPPIVAEILKKSSVVPMWGADDEDSKTPLHGDLVEAAQNLTAFHTRLVKTHDLLMSNLLISSINNNEMRWTTLSELSLRIAGEEKVMPIVHSALESGHVRKAKTQSGPIADEDSPKSE